MNLLPCPICGAGETRVDEKYNSPRMTGPGELLSVVIHHWCNDPRMAVFEHRTVRGRDHHQAEQAYNRRPEG